MTSSITKIQTITVGSGGAISIDFTNIPQTYTDLKIVYSARDTAAYGTLRVAYNNDGTVGNYAYRQFYREATTVVGDSQNELFFGNVAKNSYTASTFGTGDVYIANYASSTLSKPTLGDAASQTNGTTAIVGNFLGNYAPTTAITRVTLSLFSGSNFTEFSSATLYGISEYVESGTGSKATGGTVTTSGGYTYHTFYSSGTFAPTASITGAEYFLVAGGGSGGQGGGGAGGFRYFSAQSFTSGTKYPAIIGAGGVRVQGGNNGNNGTNSVFNGTSSTGGGAGNPANGSAGGSGGGAGGSSSLSYTGGAGNAGSYSPVEGYAGGNNQGASSSPYASAGGGGAGGAGGAPSASNNGWGGVGVNYSTWATATGTGDVRGYYAGGGGGSDASGGIGGAGGWGGGGNGGNYQTSTSGFPNTGGGGGATVSGSMGLRNNGGSGILIIRYTT